jgi:hypothetical protein
MTDYNDGKWHGWNGGDCPVHGETVVDVIWMPMIGDDENHAVGIKAKTVAWDHIDAFRVVKPHREPSEWWINVYNDGLAGAHKTRESAEMAKASNRIACIKVREVIE